MLRYPYHREEAKVHFKVDGEHAAKCGRGRRFITTTSIPARVTCRRCLETHAFLAAQAATLTNTLGEVVRLALKDRPCTCSPKVAAAGVHSSHCPRIGSDGKDA